MAMGLWWWGYLEWVDVGPSSGDIGTRCEETDCLVDEDGFYGVHVGFEHSLPVTRELSS